MKTHTRLAAFAVLAMLVFGPLSASASNLTPDLLHKILNKISTTGADKDVPAIIANALGLSAVGQPWPSRQIAATTTTSGISHGFSISRGSDQDALITVRDKDSIWVFRIHRDGTLVTTVLYDLNTNRLSAREPAETQRELDRQFTYWADELSQDK
jgi:hypothetical protein